MRKRNHSTFPGNPSLEGADCTPEDILRAEKGGAGNALDTQVEGSDEGSLRGLMKEESAE